MGQHSARRGRGIRAAAGVALLACALAAAAPAGATRIKDVTTIEGIRGNQLYGFGLVTGLAGTGGGGDFTSEVAKNMLDKLRVARGLSELDAANLAAVMVTADLPPFAVCGSTIDVTISALDETTSLRGGTLVLTPLTGADGQVYAVAQGPLTVGGFVFGGAAASVQQGHPTVGRIPNGATVEKQVATTFVHDGGVRLVLRAPDFSTATRIGQAINAASQVRAAVEDAGNVWVQFPRGLRSHEIMAMIGELQSLEVTPDAAAIVVINERTGTVVAGQNVGIATVAISHGNLTVITQEFEMVSQPGPFAGRSPGIRTETVDRTSLRILEQPVEGQEGGLTVLNQGTTVNEVARALNLLGASPRDVISIFQAIKEAGALHAELRIM